MEDPRPGRPLILVYVIVACAIVALFSALRGDMDTAAISAVVGYLTAIVHGVSFVVRAHKRAGPALLLGGSRTILASTLIAMSAAALANVVIVAVYLRDDAGELRTADAGGAAVWAIAITVLCWRAWIRPSARRAAWLQLIAVLFAVPGILGSTLAAMHKSPEEDGVFELDTTLFITLAVVGCSGAVLDKLFSALRDRPPDTVPEAIVRA